MKHKNFGFTIVELLIVIVVIGILAAISIVAYNNVNSKANDSAVQSDLANLKKKLGMFQAEKGRYPGISASVIAELNGLEFKASKRAYDTVGINLSYCFTSDGSTYTVSAKSKSGKIFTLNPTQDIKESAAMFTACTTAPYISVYSGYAQTDTASGPWRAWAGGN